MTPNDRSRRLRRTGRCRVYVPPAVILFVVVVTIVICVCCLKDGAPQPRAPLVPATRPATRKAASPTSRPTVDALAAAAQAKISRTTQPSTPPEKRAKLLEEAAHLLERIIVRAARPKGVKERLAHFRFRFQLAELYGVFQAEPHAMKMLFLQDGPEDRKIVREKAGKACELLDRLQRDIERAIQERRLERRLLTWATPQLEDFQKKVRYKAAWVYFYRGMSLPDTPAHRKERAARLRAAIEAVNEWADGAPATGVKYWSLLLRGMAYRELKQFQLARESLRKAGGEGAEPVIRVRASFEIARTFIESDDFKSAAGAIESFRTTVTGIYGERGGYAIDLNAAMLWDYSYRRQAELVAKDPRKAAALNERAALALLRVPAKHSGRAEQANWAEVIRGKYGADAEDNPAVLYAGAIGLLARWRELRGKKADVPKKLKADALRKLDKLLQGKGKTHAAGRQLIRPMALSRKAEAEAMARTRAAAPATVRARE